MKYLTSLAVAAALCLPSAARADAPLRIEDAVSEALTHNERARKAPLRVETAQGQLERARGAFYPTLNAGMSGTLRDEADRQGKLITSAGTITLTQPIVNASAFPLRSQALAQLESERWGSVQDKRVLANETARAFVQTLTAERLLEAAKRRADRALANFENAEARAAAQLNSVNDATRAAVELASARQSVATAEGATVRAYLQLGFLMGRFVQGPLAPPDRVTQAAESFQAASAGDLRAALDRRPDLLSAHERTKALEHSAREPMLRLVPTLEATAQMRVQPDPPPLERVQDSTITLNLGWNIFDAGFRYADRKSRRAQLESQALDESLLRRSVEVEVQLALASLRAAREAFRIADEALVFAQRNTDETEILYKQGLARAIELTDANARRFDAEVNRASARLSMQQAYLDLRFALGFGPTDDADSKGAP